MAYMGFKKLQAQLAKKGLKNPEAAAAAIGRKKYGKKKMAEYAAKDKKMEHVAPKKKYG